MEFYCYSPSETFVVLTADQFVGRDDGLLQQQRQDSHVCRKIRTFPLILRRNQSLHYKGDEVFESLSSFRKTLARFVMTASVRFTGVLAQGKMTFFLIFHRNFFLLTLIDHAVDLKRSVRDPRKHCAIDHLSSHGYNFERVFVF